MKSASHTCSIKMHTPATSSNPYLHTYIYTGCQDQLNLRNGAVTGYRNVLGLYSIEVPKGFLGTREGVNYV